MIRLKLRYVLAVCVAVSTIAYAGAIPPVRDHDIEPDDYFTIGTISGCAMSPDGKQVAYSEMRWEPPAERRNRDLWVVQCDSHARRRLTFDPASDRSPVWSPDGQYIYFIANRERPGDQKPPYDGKTQVWRTPPTGGDPQPVTRVEDGIKLFELSKDGRTLYYTRSDEHVDDEWKELRKEYEDLEYGHGVTDFSQVWKLDLESWRAEKVVDEKRVIRALAVSDDERAVAMITTPDDTLITNEGFSRVDVFDVDAREVAIVTRDGWRADHPSPYGWLEGLTWAPDGEALAFTVSFDGYATELYVAERPGADVSLRRLDRFGEVDASEGRLRWRGQSRELCFLGEWKARKRVYGIPEVRDGKQGKPRTLTPGDIVVDSFSFDESGNRLAAVLSTLTHPPDLYTAEIKGGEPGPIERVTNVNPQVDAWKLPQIRIVNWTGAGGVECEGILELPPEYKLDDGPLPMIVEIHGGPTAATYYRFRMWIYGRALMPARGYALFSPNYRGSTGYGSQFTSDLVGRENDIEVEDILKGVDALVDQGIADPDRLGVMGWSNGGFLTNCLIARTDRFKAASSGASVLDMIIQWGSEDTPGHVVNFMQGLVWDKPDAYRKASPIYNLHRVRTPTLIHVGGSDARCPRAHSEALYRALKHYLDVPVELVVYPGEGHGLRKYENRKAKMEWDLAWFDKYLLGKTEEKPGQSEAD
ncbi:MAG: S9 family peptidase [Phycisphaerales bacterium]|nr:MAG: S9 family peptidase [Phycisphaerales bacterium]